MKELTVSSGGIGVLYGEGKVLQSGPLGAGIAVVVLDTAARTAGLAHVTLPESPSPGKAKNRPGAFADTAIPSLLGALRLSGINKDPGELTVKVVGGTNVLDQSSVLDLGSRNLAAVKNALAQAQLTVETVETGGRHSRWVKIYVDSGMVEMITPGRGSVFI